MKTQIILSTIFLTAVVANAAPTLGVGTPGNSNFATPTGPNPRAGVLLNFDELTPNSTFNPSQYGAEGVTISSPDGLTVYPYSTQSGPNYLWDSSGNGSANVTIQLLGGVQFLGVGIADSDPVTILLQALNASGAPEGSAFPIDIATTGDPNNPGNGYYYLTDTSSDIFGLQILETAASSGYSGLAIDDVQFGPEPATVALFGAGALLLGALGLRKRA